MWPVTALSNSLYEPLLVTDAKTRATAIDVRRWRGIDGKSAMAYAVALATNPNFLISRTVDQILSQDELLEASALASAGLDIGIVVWPAMATSWPPSTSGQYVVLLHVEDHYEPLQVRITSNEKTPSRGQWSFYWSRATLESVWQRLQSPVLA